MIKPAGVLPTIFVLAFAGAVLPAIGAAAEMSGRDIVGRLDEMGPVRDFQADLEMRIISRSGQERQRLMNITTKKREDGGRMTLIRFSSPAMVKDTAYLSITKPGAEDESWLYLPALGKPKRIATGERNGSFMGSDFTYADIGLLKIDNYRHTFLRSERFEGEDVFVVESVPVSEAVRRADGFAKKTWWIRKDTYTVAKTEYTDLSGKLLKVLRGSAVAELSAGAWLATVMEMKNLQTGSRTIVTFRNIKADTGVGDEYFSVSQLARRSG